MNEELSIVKWKFWDLVAQKLIRNFASLKLQVLLMLYVPVIYGIFSGSYINGQWVSIISPTTGLAFIGGGYITLALGRIYAETKLTEDGHNKDKQI